jgi:hypothetical protein
MVSKVVYLQNNVRPAQNKTIYDDISLKTNGESTRNLVVPKLHKYGNIYQQ